MFSTGLLFYGYLQFRAMTKGHPLRKPAGWRIGALHWLVAACAANAAQAAHAATHAATARPPAGGGVEVGVMLALLLGLAICGIALLWGMSAAWQRQAARWRTETAALRQQLADHAAFQQLLDVWHWRTDAQHRLVELKPPLGTAPTAIARSAAAADSADSADAADSRPPQPAVASDVAEPPAWVWQRFAPAVVSHLQQPLEAHLSISDLQVRMLDSATQPLGAERAPAAWSHLRACPLFDARGVFLGHVGTLRPLPQERAAAPSTATAPHRASVASPTPLPLSAAIDTSADANAAANVDASADTGHSDGRDDAASFSYIVSHDLRAPIRVVEGFTKIVKEDYGRLLDRVGNDHLDRVLGAAARMNRMIDALLALSQLTAKPISREPVNLSQLADFVVEDLRRQWPRHAVQVQVQPDLMVQGDATLLRVVLENLLGNAWKYTGHSAAPQVWFGHYADAQRRVDNPHPNRHLAAPAFTVRDNGAGFDMRYADRLFGVFQRLHSATEFPGTGVGLASVRHIVRKHGGDAWAEGEVGHGACFHFSLGNGSPVPLPLPAPKPTLAVPAALSRAARSSEPATASLRAPQDAAPPAHRVPVHSQQHPTPRQPAG
jgi:signal transduction histidine kinase